MTRFQTAFLLSGFLLLFSCPAFGMDAPGNGGKNWNYGKDHHWTYQEADGSLHTGWLYDKGEWYWFDERGWLQTGGQRDIDGVRYFFFSNGHMAYNQYVDLKFLGENGQEEKEHAIRVIGTERPDSMDKDLITDYLYEVPGGRNSLWKMDGSFFFIRRNSIFPRLLRPLAFTMCATVRTGAIRK